MVRFEDLTEGLELPPLTMTPQRSDAVRYCGFAWVFPALFYDSADSEARGMPGPIVPGPLKLGAFLRAAEDWLGESGYVRHVRAAYRQPDLAGREVRVAGHVVRVYQEGARRLADLEMALVNADGRATVRGFLTVELFPEPGES